MEQENSLRIDKWLWAVRIFKTRSKATEACKKGHILIGDVSAKPSRIINVGEVIEVKRPPAIFKYRVKGLLGKRLSAKLVVEYVEDITPPEEIERLKALKTDPMSFYRPKGQGRPTKKDRRTIDNFKQK